jgi:hypothetical protein
MTVTVTVYDSSSEEDMTWVIIITVVCCAVGTSLVWVIIIYQARKRLNTTPALPPVHLDNKSEHSSSSKDNGTGDSTKRSHEDLLLESGNFPNVCRKFGLLEKVSIHLESQGNWCRVREDQGNFFIKAVQAHFLKGIDCGKQNYKADNKIIVLIGPYILCIEN